MNEDNRNYAMHAKIPLYEPSDSQEAKDMIKDAFEISEKFDTPVLIRMTTRVCHSKSVVIFQERSVPEYRPYKKDIKKYMPVPVHAKALRKR